MKFVVRILRRAEGDLREIRRYIAGDSPGAAVAVVDRLLDAIERLSQFPNRGARPRDEGLRAQGYRFLVEGSYLIFYKVGRTQVRVFRVLHGKRAYERLL